MCPLQSHEETEDLEDDNAEGETLLPSTRQIWSYATKMCILKHIHDFIISLYMLWDNVIQLLHLCIQWIVIIKSQRDSAH